MCEIFSLGFLIYFFVDFTKNSSIEKTEREWEVFKDRDMKIVGSLF